jgi:phthiocerol/phenolphthiocerol synthesis type-I polyketide synthase E
VDEIDSAAATGIAIVGIAGRFPGADDVFAFWRNLHAGVDSISRPTVEALVAAGIDRATAEGRTYIRAKGVLADADCFDAAFFDINPRTAELLDPQHRLFLECAWHALEDAGIPGEPEGRRIGVFAGSSAISSYYHSHLLANPAATGGADPFQMFLLNQMAGLPAQVSYRLNLTGPSLAVQTACSTSLTAVVLACQNLNDYQCDVALAGAASLSLPLVSGYAYQEGSILSPDGRCRAFDAEARGTVPGNGVGAVVLKRLADALADGDHVYAVIRGYAANNDGSDKIGFTAPGVTGQMRVVADALAMADVAADTIGYVEGHGTGTRLGDAIEVEALRRVFRAETDRVGFCGLGSVKSNIGHLDAAAGIAGLIKLALSFRHRTLPPSIHVERPNPDFAIDTSPFHVIDRPMAWDAGTRRAGLSSFGMGGANVHLVLEEAPPAPDPAEDRPGHLLVLSARTPGALARLRGRLADHLETAPEDRLADIAATLQSGRKPFAHRWAAACDGRDAALARLRTVDTASAAAGSEVPGVVFMFPGQGAQHPGMAAELYLHEPAFRAEVDACCAGLRSLGVDLLADLLADRADIAAAERLRRTELAQPALFVVEYALARLMLRWGIRPAALVGHSIGEYVAACLAGVMTRDDALRVVAERGRLMQSLPAGAMLSVRAGEAELAPYLRPDVSVAAVNAPDLSVLSGPTETVAGIARALEQAGLPCRPLNTSHAFHSAMTEPILEAFRATMRTVTLRRPQLPYISNLTGAWITPAQATDPDYHAAHLRQPVRFADGLAALAQAGHELFLELGPGTTLTTLVRRQGVPTPSVAVATLPQSAEKASALVRVLEAVGTLWTRGVVPDWAALRGTATGRRIPLPPYPFERTRHWVPAPGVGSRGEPILPVAAPEARPAEAPASAEQAIAALWRDHLGFAEIGPDDDFHAMGGDSLLAVQIVAELNRRFDAGLQPHDLIEAPTARRLAQRLSAGRQRGEDRPFALVSFRSGKPHRAPLFLFHAVGGTVDFYKDLAAALDPDLPIHAFQSRALDGRTEPDTEVADMTRRYVSILRGLQPRGPYRLAGSSFGGTLAYEAAAQLTQTGESVSLLAMMDTPGPGEMPKDLIDDAEVLSYIATMLDRPLAADALRPLALEAQIARFLDHCADRMPQGMTVDGFAVYLRVFKVNTQAMRAYRPPALRLSAPILFFRAAERDAYTPQRPERAWQALLGEPAVAAAEVPGTHLSMMERPHLARMAEMLNRALA